MIIYCIRFLCDWSFRLYHHIIYICYFVASILFLRWHSSYGVVLNYYQKRFSFSLKVSLFQPCPSFLVWDFACLSLEMSIQSLLFFPIFLLSGYFCSIDPCVVCIVSGDCNQSSSALFYVVFSSLYRCIDVILNAGKSSSSFFSWNIYFVCQRHLRVVRHYACSLVFWFFGPFVWGLLSSPSRMVPSIRWCSLPIFLSICKFSIILLLQSFSRQR